MSFLFSLLDSPYFWPVVLIVTLYFVYQKLGDKLSIRVPGGGLSVEGLVGRLLGSRYAEAKLQKEVDRQVKAGNVLMAGKLLEDSGKLPEAVEAYLGGSEFYAAAGLLEKMGKLERSAELFLQAGDYKKAAQVFSEAGKPARAAALFQERGNNLEAARLFGLAGAWDKAAELYAKSGYPLRAAEAYEKKGEFLKAAECHEKHFTENVSFSTTYSATAPSADQKSSLYAGRLYEKAGEVARALSIYQKGGYFREAAGACMKLGQYPKAAELYLRAEDPGSAADAYEKAGDAPQAALLRGEVALKADKVAEAAACFQAGRDYLRAAELFESIDMYAEAAGAYAAGDSYSAAGGVFIRAGMKGKAAESYERAGEYETAAKLYEESGNAKKAVELYEKAELTFKSGEAAAKAGDKDRAIALLQRVSPQDENYRPAIELLSRLFIENRMPGLATERLVKILAGQPVSAANLDLNYWLAASYEVSGNVGEAVSLYKKILAEDLHFRDVEKRVVRLQGAAGAPTAPRLAPPTAAPPPGQRPASPAASSPNPATPTAAKPAGAKAARFATREEIGRGPLGIVSRGEDLTDGRSVALRSLPADALRADGALQAIVADLKAAAGISHPNLVKVLGLVEISSQRCVVSELVTGRNLAEALKAGHKMSFSQVHSLGRILAQALSLVHSKGIVHGAVKPSNVMVASGVVKIADLGLGRLAFATIPNEEYRAPENRLDPSGDLYGLAAILYHLLTGVSPKSQPQGTGLPLPSKLAPAVPEAFDKLILRCLHPRPELRFASADEILRELKDMVHLG